MLFKYFADNTREKSVATALRKKRFQILVKMIDNLEPPIEILDIGGRIQYWQMMCAGTNLFENLNITLLNLEPQDPQSFPPYSPNFRSIVADGRDLGQFSDCQFDVVFSNSTIEHVGGFEDQARLAAEICRVGRYYYVQTPNRNFPFEPHFVFLYFHSLPLSSRVWLVNHFNLGWYKRSADRQEAEMLVKSIRLLKKSEFRELFPDAIIYEERYFGMLKSFVAYTLPNTGNL